MRLIATALVFCTLQACTWVDLTEGGQGVTVVSSVPETCKRLGATSSTTKADIASIDRSSKKVATELQTLARNAAANMGGDTIVAESDISQEGEQRFGIYRCGAQ